MKYVSESMKIKAKTVHFNEFMLVMYPDECRPDGRDYAKSTVLKGVVFTNDGFYDNYTQNRGDGIQFLRQYHKLSFDQAVTEICAYADSSFEDPRLKERNEALRIGAIAPKGSKPFRAPIRDTSVRSNEDMVDYLRFRGLDMTADMEGLVYPTGYKCCTNIVFLSRDCQYGELQGSIPGSRFKQKISGADSDGYWIIGAEDPKRVYVCESAIDALSLRQIQQNELDSAFASIGGCGCKKAVERIRQTYPKATLIIAFDHDEAGQRAANGYTDPKLVPVSKDWNDDLRRHILTVRKPNDGLDTPKKRVSIFGELQ